jgi:DNA-binding NarL/FixJ family response regulator
MVSKYPVASRNMSQPGLVMRKRVLIVDDNAFIRQALFEFFGREQDFEVCGLADDGNKGIEEALRLHPDIVVLDFSMPVMNGLDAARVLKRLMPSAFLIMYSAFDDRRSEQEARAIAEVVSKSDSVSVLIDTARSVSYSRAA